MTVRLGSPGSRRRGVDQPWRENAQPHARSRAVSPFIALEVRGRCSAGIRAVSRTTNRPGGLAADLSGPAVARRVLDRVPKVENTWISLAGRTSPAAARGESTSKRRSPPDASGRCSSITCSTRARSPRRARRAAGRPRFRAEVEQVADQDLLRSPPDHLRACLQAVVSGEPSRKQPDSKSTQAGARSGDTTASRSSRAARSAAREGAGWSTPERPGARAPSRLQSARRSAALGGQREGEERHRPPSIIGTTSAAARVAATACPRCRLTAGPGRQRVASSARAISMRQCRRRSGSPADDVVESGLVVDRDGSGHRLGLKVTRRRSARRRAGLPLAP